MIGAGGRNAGKTGFACAVIRRLSTSVPVIGVKVTAISERDDECPRGGEGCGTCASFSGQCLVTEERGELPGKDTSRMLAAGAKKVFWVRVMRESLAQAAAEVKGLLEPGQVMICESNSMRLLVEPDLFFIVREKGSTACKPTCAAVAHLADCQIESDRDIFSLPPEKVDFAFGHWTFKRNATAIVMAGGDSARMGRDKALLEIEGEPMISRIVSRLEPSFERVVISAAGAGDLGFLGKEVIPDEAPGAGPLMALVSALEKSKTELNFIMPCDLPDPPQHLLARLLREASNAEVAVPVNARGELEPLFAVYKKSVLPSAREALAQGKRRVISFYPQHKVKQVPLNPDDNLLNLNTITDYLTRLNNGVKP